MYSINAITAKIAPDQAVAGRKGGCSGMELMMTDSFRLHCFQTQTGTFS
jgi:hypothetical protein